jgi:hypothetical protein
MSNDVPLLVQFDFEQGTLQFFLAPKVGLFLVLGSYRVVSGADGQISDE